MSDEALKIGRLEDKFQLYEPLLVSLLGLVSIPDEIGKIHTDLRALSDSRIEVREQLKTLFKTQNKVYDEIVKKLEVQTKALEKEVSECPIDDVVARVVVIERDVDIVEALDDRLSVAEKRVSTIKGLTDRLGVVEKTIESFKLKGWDLLFRIAPWIIALSASGYVVLNK